MPQSKYVRGGAGGVRVGEEGWGDGEGGSGERERKRERGGKRRRERDLSPVLGEDTDLSLIQEHFAGQSNQHCNKANLAPTYTVGWQ